MMISVSQLAALSSSVLDQFSRDAFRRLAADLPEWAATASEDTRQKQLSGITKYGHELKIVNSEDLYRFVLAVLRYELSIPLRPELLLELRQPGISKGAQIENMMLRLISNRDRKTAVRL